MKLIRRIIILAAVAATAATLICIDNLKVHPQFEHILTYNYTREVENVQWICVKEHGYTGFEFLQKEIQSNIGYLSKDTIPTSGYAYVIIYGGELIDIEYSKNAISNWIFLNLFGSNQYDESYGNVYVSKTKPEEVNIYRFKDCPFEQDIHSNGGQLRIVSQ